EKPSTLKQIKNKRELKLAKRWEHTKASLRAKVEHPFRVIKRQFGYVKVRYRGLAKTTAQVLTLFAPSNSVADAQSVNACCGEGVPATRATPRKRAESGNKSAI
ncbi:transposase, partial [Xanthomonas vasicola pv. vasculorum NCPPB 206]